MPDEEGGQDAWMRLRIPQGALQAQVGGLQLEADNF